MKTHDPFAPISPELKTSAPTTLFLKEKSENLTGADTATVKDSNGKIIYKIGISANMFTGHRRILLDSHGHAIGQLHRKILPAIYPTYFIGTKDDEKRCAVTKKALMDVTTHHVDILLGDEVIGEASSDWKEKNFTIKIKDKIVAKVHRNTVKPSNFLVREDGYCMDIQEGIDTAFITMVTVALDELYRDHM